jgi:RHS repeat-associated protein
MGHVDLLSPKSKTLKNNITAKILGGYDCNELEQLVQDFIHEYGTALDPEDCKKKFTEYFNAHFGTSYTWEEIVQIYIDSCGHGPGICETFNCRDLEDLITLFYQTYGYTITQGNCVDLFVAFFNAHYHTNYSWQEIINIYNTYCDHDPDVCNCYNTIWCFDPVCDTTYSGVYNLLQPEPLPEFLKCGYTGNWHCLSCAQLSSFTDEYKNVQFPMNPYNAAPIFTGTNLSQQDIDNNILYARFINYRTGFQYTWLDYAQAAANANPACNLANYGGNGNANQNVICGNTTALNDTTGIFVHDPPCQHTYNMAVSLGQQVYQVQTQTLLANFEAAYRGKCYAAKDIETFTVTYSNKEYHYTLYYYDMAGNLVKTVPPKGVRPDFTTSYTNQVKTDRANGVLNQRPHEYITQYCYNSLNQAVAQNSPDGGTSNFWYDKLGRLVVSRNAQQAIDGKWSYTLYDDLGRIAEVGQKPQTTAMTQTISQDPTALNNWINVNGGTKEQITYTVYDLAYPAGLSYYLTQQNLRNRVSYVYTKNLATDASQYHASFYSYDIHGNVDTLLQDYNGIAEMSGGNRFKRMVYDYDLISGKVNMVSYQPRIWNPGTNSWIINTDAFYHRYSYDAENRLVFAETSRDKIVWERDAAYSYYKYGPLARTELGQMRVQGMDYAYTLQGWLKGVNSTNLDPTVDLGRDGTGLSSVARDVLGFSLHYFDETSGNNTWLDYKPLNGTTAFARPASGNNLVSLYNGNIGAITMNNGGLLKGGSYVNSIPLFYNYGYDQLNRIVSMQAYSGLNSNNTWTPVATSDYHESISYDPNGNILSYNRRASQFGGGQLPMDSLTYDYYTATNRLKHVGDNVAGGCCGDIQNQTNASNYTYDAIGNLTSDVAEGIGSISWSVYGKIQTIIKGTTTITYNYDAPGARIRKSVTTQGRNGYETNVTVYVRDASGNVMSIYEKPNGQSLKQTELDIYGSSRLGMATEKTVVAQTFALAGGFGNAILDAFTRSEKLFELTNHLGNVLTTISDKKLQHSSDNTTIDYYYAEVWSAKDYYPFGMMMPARRYEIGNSYRYGFNGKENDNEVKGDGDQQDYGMRIYDPRLGRFLSVDPLTNDYPSWSPYPFAMNRPVDGIDLDGEEWKPYYSSNDKEKKNPIGYNWVGYDDFGTPPAGTVANATLDKGRYFYFYSSDQKNMSGKLEIYSKDKKPVPYPQGPDNSTLFNYTFYFNQHYGSDKNALTRTKVTGDIWNVEYWTSFLSGQERSKVNYYAQNEIVEDKLKIWSINIEDLFYSFRKDHGLGVPATAITSIYPETIFIPVFPEIKGASLIYKGESLFARTENLLVRQTGGWKQWFRVGPSYSIQGQFKTFGLRWGASPKYAPRIGNTFLRGVNQNLRNLKIPLNSWRTADPGHLHFWRL